MKTKTITVRIPSDIYDGMQAKAENIGSISQQIVDGLRKNETIAKLSLGELKGKFSEEEWCALSDMLNGTIVDDAVRYYTNALVAEVQDSELYDGTCSKWKVSTDGLIAKVEKLTAAQLDALYTRVETFWAHPEADIMEWAKF